MILPLMAVLVNAVAKAEMDFVEIDILGLSSILAPICVISHLVFKKRKILNTFYISEAFLSAIHIIVQENIILYFIFFCA